MSPQHASQISRRAFFGGLTLAGTAGLLGLPSPHVAAEPPPETTTLRLTSTPAICLAPQYVAAELLRGEGFTEVQDLKTTAGGGTTRALAAGEAHISTTFSGPFLLSADAGEPIVLLAAGHVGCFELFGTGRVRAIRDLKGKTVAVPEWGSGHHVFIPGSEVGPGPVGTWGKATANQVDAPGSSGPGPVNRVSICRVTGLVPPEQAVWLMEHGTRRVDPASRRGAGAGPYAPPPRLMPGVRQPLKAGNVAAPPSVSPRWPGVG